MFSLGVSATDPRAKLQEVGPLHRLGAPLSYPLLFLFGEPGWGLKCIAYNVVEGQRARARGHVTALEYLRFRLFERDDLRTAQGDSILRDAHLLFGRLTQQWIVDECIKIETSRLTWFRLNQKTIRADEYKEVQRAIAANEAGNVGTHVVLPATHIGGPRDMQQRFADAMAVVRSFASRTSSSPSRAIRGGRRSHGSSASGRRPTSSRGSARACSTSG